MKIAMTILALFFLVGCGDSGGDSVTAPVSMASDPVTIVADDGTTTVVLANLQTELGTYPVTDLSAQEEEDLLVLREEEKVAHDVYTALYALYGQRTFNNISDAEQTHSNAVLVLIERYGLEDPVGENTIGVFENEELQQLHDTLVAQGSTTLLDALLVGATIEDVDIYDIGVMKSQTDNEDLLLVYNSLEKGSRNHMRAFVSQIEALGGSYTPQYISQEAYDAIVTSEMERGN